MTRDEARKLLPIFKAYGEGKGIQWLNGNEWCDLPQIDLLDLLNDIVMRIKPETKKVPMTYEDFKGMPVVWILINDFKELIVKINDDYIFTNDNAFTFDWAFGHKILWSTDRVNWHKFEKEVEE